MISKKTLILHRLTAHLEGVSYNTTFVPGGVADLTGKVYRGRGDFGEETVEPFISILEAPRQVLPDTAGTGKTSRNDFWKLLIQGFAPDDKKHPYDPAYEFLGHVEARLARLVQENPNGTGATYPEEFKLGKLVRALTFENPIVRPPTDGVSDTAFFYMPVTFEIVTDMVSPFIEET